MAKQPPKKIARRGATAKPVAKKLVVKKSIGRRPGTARY